MPRHWTKGEQYRFLKNDGTEHPGVFTFLEIDYYPTTRGIRSRVYAVECTDEIRTANLVEDIDDAASEIAEKIFLFVRVKNYKHPKIRILLSPEARLPPPVVEEVWSSAALRREWGYVDVCSLRSVRAEGDDRRSSSEVMTTEERFLNEL